MANKETITYKINNAEFEAKFLLETSGARQGEFGPPDPGQGGDKSIINFSKSAVRGMDIEENFLEPFTNGNIYINNPLDFIEDGGLIRGDGGDTFTIEFYDKSEGEPTNGFAAVAREKKLKYEFVIGSEVNSASQTDRLNNFKIYSLIDKNYHLLNARIPFGKRYRGKVGDIIKSILVEVLGEDKVTDCLMWDSGDMVIDTLPEHILPPSTFRYSDLIKYLLKLNYKKVGKTYVKLFLNWCRTCEKYQYLPLSDYFEFAAAEPEELFMANDLIDKVENNPNNPATAPGVTPVNVYNSPLQNSDLSTPMLTYTNAYLTNMLVSDYDPTLGEHKINVLRIKDIKEEWKKLFVDKFKYSSGKAQPWVILNDIKTSEVFRGIGFPFAGDRAKKMAEAELTTNMTFFNLQLNFSSLGNVAREPGKGIDIAASRPQQEETGVDHRSDAKLLGTWFITKVRHEFNSAKVDGYTNIMQCIKPHIGPGVRVPLDSDLQVNRKSEN